MKINDFLFRTVFFDVDNFFKPCIGVTRTLNQSIEEIIFRVNSMHAPYVISKPLHSSQKILEQDERGAVFSIRVVHNFELEKEILSFGNGITILQPKRLRKAIEKRMRLGLEQYEAITERNKLLYEKKINQLKI